MGDASHLRKRRLRFRRKRASKRSTMTMMEHLGELRRRLIISLVAFFLISIVAFIFFEPLKDLIREPLCKVPPEKLGELGCDLVFRKVLGAFMFRLKLTALAGLVLTSPIWLYQIWAFITPGLTMKEKKYAIPFAISSFVLFVAGGTVAYLMLPTGMSLLIGFAGEGVTPLLEAEEYLNFVGLMFLGFGFMFEVPLILFFLGLAGIVTVEMLKKQRRLALVLIVAMAALVTPSQDPYTLLVLAVPLYLLYELVIVILRLVARRRAKATAAA
jgi:sec-independent protein translocase protein TatC